LDYDRALREFTAGLRSQPRNSSLLGSAGVVRRRQGQFQLAAGNLEDAIRVDPRSTIWVSNLGETYMLLSRFRDAERVLGQAIELSRDWAEPHVWRIALYPKWPGHRAQARAAVDEGALSIAVAADQDFVYWVLLVDIVERKYDEALTRLAAMTAEAFDGRNQFVPRAQVQSTIYGLMNRPAQASVYADTARMLVERAIRQDSADARLHSALGLAYASLGRRDDAIREGLRGVALAPLARDAYRGTFRLEDLALIYAGVGELDRAIDQLQVLLTMPSLLSPARIRLDPRWEPLRANRRFQQLIATR
jgi:tetratricopeptide (TPR) repeat protein